MKHFIERHRGEISGVLSGFDRLVFRGTLRSLYAVPVMDAYLSVKKVLYKDFDKHVKKATEELIRASLRRARNEGRPVEYLASSNVSKEDTARGIAGRDKVREGLVCVLKSVEPCISFEIHRSREQQKLVLERRQRKCTYLYHYWMHPTLGFMHARIQTWFPFPVQVCLNGREWLARQMDGAGVGYARRDNCFVRVDDFQKAQALLDEQVKADWPSLLGAMAAELNPAHRTIFGDFPAEYYWSAHQSEWATDIVFGRREYLERMYARLLHHGMTTFGSTDVLRFLGKRLTAHGRVPGMLECEVMTDLRTRQEGTRLKHWLNGNTLKMYDKAYSSPGNVLRVETTIYNEEDFKVYRPREGDPDGKLEWRALRRGVADLYRRAEVSQAANERYLNALATVSESATVEELTEQLETPVQWNKQRVRGLRIFGAEDGLLLAIIANGDFLINGLRNRDLQARLFAKTAADARESKRRTAKVSRLIRMLRAHGLLGKVPRTHRYMVTDTGRKVLTAIATARRATIAQLTAMAA